MANELNCCAQYLLAMSEGPIYRGIYLLIRRTRVIAKTHCSTCNTAWKKVSKSNYIGGKNKPLVAWLRVKNEGFPTRRTNHRSHV